MSYSLYGYGERLPKKEIMAGIECDKSRIVARNTVRYEREGLVAFRLYRTTIVEQTHDGLWIRTEGLHSTLTTGRINMALSSMGLDHRVVRVGSYGCHNTYLKTHNQMVPINSSIFLPNDGELEERSCNQDANLRKWLWWTHNWGFTESPLTKEWDGRASTLRSMLFDWRKPHSLPWGLLVRLPGFKIELYRNTDHWRHPKMSVRHVCVNYKIRLRNLIDDILYAGHIDNLKEKK